MANRQNLWLDIKVLNPWFQCAKIVIMSCCIVLAMLVSCPFLVLFMPLGLVFHMFNAFSEPLNMYMLMWENHDINKQLQVSSVSLFTSALGKAQVLLCVILILSSVSLLHKSFLITGHISHYPPLFVGILCVCVDCLQQLHKSHMTDIVVSLLT